MQWVRALSLHQARNLALIVFENYLDPLGHSTSRPSPARPGQYPHPRKYGLRCKFLCRAGPGRAGPGRPGLCYGLRGPDNFQTLYRQIWLRGSKPRAESRCYCLAAPVVPDVLDYFCITSTVLALQPLLTNELCIKDAKHVRHRLYAVVRKQRLQSELEGHPCVSGGGQAAVRKTSTEGES